jgi:hypothetical protein
VAKPLDRRGLRDVERFPGGDRSGLVDQADRPHDVAASEHVRGRAANLSRAENRHFTHAVVHYSKCRD